MSKQASAFALPVAPLMEKMNSLDPDYRVMALMDTQKELLRSTNYVSTRSSSNRPLDQTYMDEVVEGKLTGQVLKLLGDSNAEVKNAAVPCLALLTRKARRDAMNTITNDLTTAIGSDDEEKRDVACLALKSVVAEMPQNGSSTSSTINTLITKVMQNLQTADDHPQVSFELLAILTDIFTRFRTTILSLESTQRTSLTQLSALLSTARPNIRKRATTTLAALISSGGDALFRNLVDDLLDGLSSEDQETSSAWVGVLGALARSSSRLVGSVLDRAMPGVMAQLEDVENADAVEGALVTLDVLVLRCPTETASYLSQIISKALELVKYDPNFVQIDDEDDPMEDDDEEDEDDDYEDAYSDDEDVSWKIRRSAAKLLLVLIATRNELLGEFYRTASPVLISRFEEREESVRIEILEAYQSLLTQTAAVSGAAEQSGRNKRKRSEGMDEPEDESPLGQLQAQLPALLKVLLKLLSVKSLATRQQAFSLLRQITLVLDGGLEAHSSAICKSVASALQSSDHATTSGGGATTSSLTVAVLSFLSAFFARHPSKVYASYLHGLAPRIVEAMLDKLQRVSSEGFITASALVCAIRPISPRGSASPLPGNYNEPVRQIYTATRDVLMGNTADMDVRERALETLGDLIVHEGDSLAGSFSECLPLVTARLANEGTQSTAVIVIGRIAESPTAKGEAFEAWLLEALTAVAVSLRRNKRLSKASTLNCLSALLTRIGSNLPAGTASDLVLELKPLLDTPMALQVVVLVLSLQPASRPTIETEVLPTVLEQIKSSLIQPAAVDALLAFFAAWVSADPDCATRVVPGLAELLDTSGRLPDASQGGTVAFTTAAKCIGATVASSQRNAAGIIALFAKAIEKKDATEAETYFALLALGEIGRITDMSVGHKIFDRVLALFGSKSEEIRSAAAFAAGNMAVGSPTELLPAILQNVSADKSASERLLFLHALKEVILHMTAAQLESIADSLWTPLFADETESGDDGERNVKAACVGKLTTASPRKYLPQLQSRLQSSASTRAMVAAAIRYTFIDTSSSYDELLAPFVVDFLSLMHDSDLIVRRLSLNSLNAAIQNKPHLVIDHLATLQPLLYSETHVNPDLCRKVPMGPWTVIEDDGLENRKTAYETMYNMLSTCFIKIDLPAFLDRVLAALSDVNEVKILGFMLLHRLCELAPTLVASRLDDTTEAFDLTMRDLEVKDDTIRQDLERKEEMQRSALRTLVPLHRLSNPVQNPQFHAFATGIFTSNKWKDVKDLN